MKTISDQLYGYSYELDTTSADDGTKCYAVDTGTIFVAFGGLWYEQPRAYWSAIVGSENDPIYDLRQNLNIHTPADDLDIFNALDTGEQFRSFNGVWYGQPSTAWAAPAPSGGGSGLPDPTEANDGDVLTVSDGAWAAAAPSGGAHIVPLENFMNVVLQTTETAGEIYEAYASGVPVLFVYEHLGNTMICQVIGANRDSEHLYLSFTVNHSGDTTIQTSTGTESAPVGILGVTPW